MIEKFLPSFLISLTLIYSCPVFDLESRAQSSEPANELKKETSELAPSPPPEETPPAPANSESTYNSPSPSENAPPRNPGYQGSQNGAYNSEQPEEAPASQPIAQPGYQPGFEQGYQPGFEQGYQPGQQPGPQPGYQRQYQQGNQPEPGYQNGYRQNPRQSQQQMPQQEPGQMPPNEGRFAPPVGRGSAPGGNEPGYEQGYGAQPQQVQGQRPPRAYGQEGGQGYGRRNYQGYSQGNAQGNSPGFRQEYNQGSRKEYGQSQYGQNQYSQGQNNQGYNSGGGYGGGYYARPNPQGYGEQYDAHSYGGSYHVPPSQYFGSTSYQGGFNSGPRSNTVYAPQGLNLPVTLQTAISTQVAKPGDLIQGEISHMISLGGRGYIPAGTQVVGDVGQSRAGRRLSRSGALSIEFTSMRLPSGQQIPISAHLVGSIGKYKNKGQGSQDMYRGEGVGTKVGQFFLRGLGGAGLGAALGTGLGAIAGGRSGVGRGAWGGAAIGGGLGAADMLLRKGKDVIIPTGTEIQIQLDQAAALPSFASGNGGGGYGGGYGSGSSTGMF